MTDTLATGAVDTGTAAPAADTNAPAAVETAAPAAPTATVTDKGPATAAPANWPDDWRQKIAGDDAKALERLGRFASPADVFKAHEEAQARISKGIKPAAKPGPDAKPEEWAEYRKATGIPEEVGDYVKAIALPDKREIGDADKPMVEAFSRRALAAGIAPSDMSALIDEYYLMQEEQAAAREEKDAELRISATNELRQEWGGEYKANVAALRPYFEGVDGELFNNLMAGRLADGSKIGDHPGVIRFFVAKALAENPTATLVPAGGAQLDTIENEIATLEKRMGADRDAWFKDEKAQGRLQKLYAARDKLATK